MDTSNRHSGILETWPPPPLREQENEFGREVAQARSPNRYPPYVSNHPPPSVITVACCARTWGKTQGTHLPQYRREEKDVFVLSRWPKEGQGCNTGNKTLKATVITRAEIKVRDPYLAAARGFQHGSE